MPMHPFKPLVHFLIPVLSVFTAAAAEEEWPEFRGPQQQGVSAAKNVPVRWGAEDNVVWRVEVPGKGWSSPALSGGKIYLTTAVGDSSSGVTLHALCLDAKDGHQLWDTEIFRPDGATASAMHRKNSLASPTPIVSGGRVYVHFGHMGTA